ncbi:DUF1580 domain-containing protein [Neorhodopirellula pilleata]|uniref:Uncharacterized protein n=1 Tax=Neorhodopirellula pilleata TaxID=2714738 RepID=A0A5C6A8Q1_9BACT|nr:DUF1580 domain-containing protein [Neorhodopirellula pilleata]TWT95770.1 hypothetical protein Pla100_34120 [Neorhodopirellula pilleata]
MTQTEPMMALTDAIRAATGLERDRTTGQRWMRDGMQTYLVGGRRCTTPKDVLDYIRRKTEESPVAASVQASRSPAKRQRDQSRASRQLESLGA